MYFCKNCGSQYVTDQAVMCVKCGAAKGTGMNFCQNCGSQTPPNSAVCLNCGVATAGNYNMMPGAKSKVCAGLLAIFLGAYGVHNFYLGYTTKAVIQLVGTIVSFFLMLIGIGFITLSAIGIWALIEGIMILSGSINVDGNGMPLKD